MKLLWNGAWRTAPAYSPVPGSVPVEVRAAIPLIALGPATGRRLEDPVRKLTTFAALEGPRAAWSKTRAKYRTQQLAGDYHAVLALGEDPSGRRVAALCLRAPRCAQQLLTHEDLVIPTELDVAGLPGVAAALVARLAPHASLLRQAYLYSGMRPPEALAGALREALASPGPGPAPLVPPAGGDRSTRLQRRPVARGAVTVLGAGDHVQAEVLPAAVEAGLEIGAVVDREPQVAAAVAARFGAAVAATDAQAVLAESPPGIVVVATAHDAHARLACAALDAGHQVILEKPTVVTREDLDALLAAVARHPGRLAVGFNRRFHPLVRAALQELTTAAGPATVTCVARGIEVEPDHWYLWPNQGTSIAGNVCHWIDLGVLFTGAWPDRVHVATGGSQELGEPSEVTLTTTFRGGGLLTVQATSRGDATRGVQERVEVRRGDLTLDIDDLRELRVLRGGRRRRRRALFRDRAHRGMYGELFAAFQAGRAPSLPTRQLAGTALVQIAAAELVRAGGGSVEIEPEGSIL